jgi:hypothetical protein
MTVCFIHARCRFFIREVTVLGVPCFCDLLARHGQLDLVYTEVDVMADGLPHFQWSFRKRCYPGNKVAVWDCHFFAIGEIAWAGKMSFVDRVSDDAV